MGSFTAREEGFRGCLSMLSPSATEFAGARRHGFTLIEMLLVMSIIALMAAVAAPQLMPAILLSQLEGSARHVAGFGRAVISQAMLMRETITVKLDLTKQEYWATHHVNKSKSIFDEDKKEGEADPSKKSSASTSRRERDANDGRNAGFLNLLGYKPSEEDGTDWGESSMSGGNLMRKQFDRFVQTQMQARSKQVNREGLLDEIGPLFDKKFMLDENEDVEEEVPDPLLARTSLPNGVVIESVRVGSASYSKGEVSIEVTPLGLVDPVTFYIKGEEDDYFTVTWDPITGNVHIERGKKDAA